MTEHTLIAASLFKEKSSGSFAGGVAEKTTEVDYMEILSSIVLKFIDVLEGVAVVIIGIVIVRFLRAYFSRIEAAHEQQKTALNLLEKITNGFVLIVSVILALKIIGLDLTLVLSVLTLGLSFALRDVIKNYVAGLLILFKAPFEIGDIIKIRNFTGKIERIEFQAVTVRTFDLREITIHNSDLLTQPITNYSKRQQARLEITVSLGYGTNLERALKIFDHILQNNPTVLKSPRYSIVFHEFGEKGTRVLIRFWVQRPCNVLAIRSAIALAVNSSFDEAEVIAPFTREAGLDGMYGMSEARRERLKSFYGQPILADLAMQVAGQVAVATEPVATDYADADEPE